LLLITTGTPSRWASSTHSPGIEIGNMDFAIAGLALRADIAISIAPKTNRLI
jgi:hypothetical protein